jgi:hypothetical protein
LHLIAPPRRAFVSSDAILKNHLTHVVAFRKDSIESSCHFIVATETNIKVPFQTIRIYSKIYKKKHFLLHPRLTIVLRRDESVSNFCGLTWLCSLSEQGYLDLGIKPVHPELYVFFLVLVIRAVRSLHIITIELENRNTAINKFLLVDRHTNFALSSIVMHAYALQQNSLKQTCSVLVLKRQELELTARRARGTIQPV